MLTLGRASSLLPFIRTENRDWIVLNLLTIYHHAASARSSLTQLYAGKVWRALGDPENAKVALKEAEKLCSKKSIGLRARNELAEMDKRS